jgi:hypothetical protein
MERKDIKNIVEGVRYFNGIDRPINTNKHIHSSVYDTDDLDQFVFDRHNREIDESHVLRLCKKIEENNMLSSNPITVNKDMVVTDGQHRVIVAKMLGLKIYYIISEVEINDINTAPSFFPDLGYRSNTSSLL